MLLFWGLRHEPRETDVVAFCGGRLSRASRSYAPFPTHSAGLTPAKVSSQLVRWGTAFGAPNSACFSRFFTPVKYRVGAKVSRFWSCPPWTDRRGGRDVGDLVRDNPCPLLASHINKRRFSRVDPRSTPFLVILTACWVAERVGGYQTGCPTTANLSLLVEAHRVLVGSACRRSLTSEPAKGRPSCASCSRSLRTFCYFGDSVLTI